MKANHPVAFLAACMSLAMGNTDKLAALRQEAARMGIRVLPPSINESGADFRVEACADGSLAIRYALAAIKKISFAAMQSLEATRGVKKFVSLSDFAARIDPLHISKMQLENLARAGAFDALDSNRARLFAAAETILKQAQARAEEAASGQIGLFGGQGPETLRLPAVADWPDIEKLGYEADAVGFHLTAHPLDSFAATLKRVGAVSTAALQARAAAGSARVKIAGCVAGTKERTTKTGSRMAWVTLSDAAGSCEITFFSETLGRAREFLAGGTPLLVTADIKLEGEALRITAQDITSLERAAQEAGAGMRIWLQRTEAVPHIRALLEREGRGRGRISLVPMIDAQEIEVSLPGSFAVSPRLRQALTLIAGVERVDEV